MSNKVKIITIIISILIVIRLILPHILLKEINKAIADLDKYTGHIEDLDLNLYRGAFQLNKIKIEKINAKVKEPFVDVDLVDISIDWDAVFNGKLAGEILVERPIVNFAIDSTGEESQTGSENDWAKKIEELVPFETNLNTFSIKNGTIKYSDYSQQPNIVANISSLNLVATNLSNVKSPDKELPAHVKMTANSDGGGNLELNVDLDFLKDIPDFDLDFQFKNLDLVQLNEFAKAYGNFDLEEGTFSLFTELHMRNGDYNGYVKPLFENIKVIDYSEEKEDSFLQKAWETTIAIPSELFENQKKDRVASKIPIEGTVEKSDPKLFKSIINLLKNAFVKAIPKELDHSINATQSASEK